MEACVVADADVSYMKITDGSSMTRMNGGTILDKRNSTLHQESNIIQKSNTYVLNAIGQSA